MEHYYSENPTSEHDIKRIKFGYRGNELVFLTDSGVFSKDKVDYGTRLLLESLPEGLSGRILDLGCGYGAIGLSIAKAYPNVHVLLADINVRAVELARENARLNDITNAEVYQSDGFDKIDGIFDVIVTNPPIRAGKEIIYSLFGQSFSHLRSGGELYVVIQRKQGAESAMDKLAEIFGNCEKVDKSGGYWVLRCVKMGYVNSQGKCHNK